MRVCVAALAAAALLVAAPATAQSPVVATVDGSGEITEAQYDHWSKIARRSSPKASPRTIRRMVMQLLIQNLWVSGEAAERGITVTDAEVDRAFRDQKRQSFGTEREFRRFLREYGYTVADLKYRVRLEILSNRLRREVVRGVPEPTEEELRAYYDDHRARFAVPERRDVLFAVARTRAAAVAKRKRLRLYATRRHFPPAVFRRRRGVVRRGGRWLAFRVIRVHPPRTRPFEEMRDDIERQLDAEREQAALDAFIADFRERWRARTECREPYAIRECGRRIP
jgi:foldase protein PrsA